MEGTHTLVLDEICFFFFRILEKKKKKGFFFFSLEKFGRHTHSPGKKSGYTKDVITLVNRDKNSVSYRPLPWDKSTTKKSEFTPVNQRKRGKKKYLQFFFFPKKLASGNVFFFSQKKFEPYTYTLNFRGRKKKTGPEKKKHYFY